MFVLRIIYRGGFSIIARHAAAHSRQAFAQAAMWASSEKAPHAAAHLSQASAHAAHISPAKGPRREVNAAVAPQIVAQSLHRRIVST